MFRRYDKTQRFGKVIAKLDKEKCQQNVSRMSAENWTMSAECQQNVSRIKCDKNHAFEQF